MSAFGTLLVANRGEIALRIVRAARKTGVRTVAVYSDADRSATHVRAADAAVPIGPAPAAESYLSIPRILEAAARGGAQAVHPGYGFLAENPDFARACGESDLTFVGPSPETIETMGSKDSARRVAEAAGVPVVRAVAGSDDRALIEAANEEVGFPLVVKPVAGGGGKGMRVVRDPAELGEAVAASRREARAAFGADALLVERLVQNARHVEVQVLADMHGSIVHLFERDCSVQRRFQKVVEEAPAPAISEALRLELAEAAVRLAREVDYVNAGTVEFLVGEDGFHFLEMNTRLQVEHPVTELVTGLDLVEWQLRIAAGESLAFTQDDVSMVGHAIEARVYAEDPERGFLPQAGRVRELAWPTDARVDAALERGQEVGTSYDPMLAKLVVRGSDREAARAALIDALDNSAVFGVTTNLGYLRRLAASPEFADARIDTTFLDAGVDAFVPTEATPARAAAAWWRATPPVAGALAAGEAGAWPGDAGPLAAGDPGPWAAGDSWRLGAGPAPVRLELLDGDGHHVLRVDRAAGTVEEDGRTWSVHALSSERLSHGLERLTLEIDGERRVFHLVAERAGLVVAHAGDTRTLRYREHRIASPATALAGRETVLAPMPGTVLDVRTEVGREVAGGDTLLVLEAMKMELAITAPFDGSVARLDVVPGDQVSTGHLLAEVAPNGESSSQATHGGRRWTST